MPEIVRHLTEREEKLLAPMFAQVDAATNVVRRLIAQHEAATVDMERAQSVLVNALELAYGDDVDVEFDPSQRAFVRKEPTP